MTSSAAPAPIAVFLRRFVPPFAALLLGSAGVCWIAANWPYASRWQKLVGAQTLLLALVLLACWRLSAEAGRGGNRNLRASGHLAGLAGVALGGLLALVGQVYQTGADPAALFLIWAVLLLPWLLTVRTVFLGLLTALVLNVGMALWLDQEAWPWLHAWRSQAWVLALLNVALLWAWEAGARWLDDAWRTGPRVLALAVAGWLLAAMPDWLGTGMVPTAAGMLPGLLAAGVAGGYYRRRDPAMVSLAAALAFVTVAGPLLAWVETPLELTIVLLALLGVAALALRRISGLAAGLVTPGAWARDAWHMVLFRLLVLAVTVGVLLALVYNLLDFSPHQAWVLGASLCVAGTVLARYAQAGLPREMAYTLAVAGLLMVGAGVYDGNDTPWRWQTAAWLVLGGLVYAGICNAAVRGLAAFCVLALLLVLTWSDGTRAPDELVALSRMAVLTVCAVAALAGRAAAWQPLGWAAAVLAQGLAWLVPVPAWHAQAWLHEEPWAVAAWLLLAWLPVLVLIRALMRDAGASRAWRIGAPAALAVASLGWMGAPGVSLALLWLILGRMQARRSLLVLGATALVVYLALYYYQLESSLLHKSSVLALTGGWLLVCWLLLRCMDGSLYRRTPAAQGRRKGRWTRSIWRQQVGLLVGLLLGLGAAHLDIAAHERTLTRGERIVLALAPVDPRSLMQGDYMALDYELAAQVREMLEHLEPAQAQALQHQKGGYVVLHADAQGVYRPVALHAGLPESGVPRDGVWLAFRLHGGRVRVASTAWFFPEGQAATYQRARYGVVRVNDDGTGLLAGLLDERQQPLEGPFR